MAHRPRAALLAPPANRTRSPLMLNVTYLCVPPLGGLRTFYTNLRKGLSSHSIELFWLACGKSESALATQQLTGEASHGCIVAPDSDDPVTRARALIEYIHDRQIRVVLLNSVANPVTTGIAFHLPREIRRILIVHSITPMTYRTARALREYVHATVCPSPRMRADLVRHHGFDRCWTPCVAHGVDTATFDEIQRPERDGGPLRLLFLGRVEDAAKGVFWLPAILERAMRGGADVRLTVAGDGPDRTELRARMFRSGVESRVDFLGAVAREQVPTLAAGHDLFLMPSRFEGLPFSLLEAMAAGCVPVCSKLRGVTDFVVEHGRTGLLFPLGSVRLAAEHVARLSSNRPLLAAMSAAARQEVRARFNVDQQAERYAALIRRVLQAPRVIHNPLPVEPWSSPRGFRPGWWYWLPTPVKNALRVARERLPLAARQP